MPKILDLIMDFSMPTTSIFNIDDLDIEKNFRYFFYLVANRKKKNWIISLVLHVLISSLVLKLSCQSWL